MFLGSMISGLGLVSIACDSVIASTRQWHCEHVLIHGVMAMWMVGLGGFFMEDSIECRTIEFWGMGVVAILLQILVIQHDTNEQAAARAELKRK